MTIIKQCRSQIKITGLMKINAVLSFGASLFYMVLLLIRGLTDSEFDVSVRLLALLPILLIANSALIVLCGYPFYVYFCKKNRGIEVSGFFVQENNQDVSDRAS